LFILNPFIRPLIHFFRVVFVVLKEMSRIRRFNGDDDANDGVVVTKRVKTTTTEEKLVPIAPIVSLTPTDVRWVSDPEFMLFILKRDYLKIFTGITDLFRIVCDYARPLTKDEKENDEKHNRHWHDLDFKSEPPLLTGPFPVGTYPLISPTENLIRFFCDTSPVAWMLFDDRLKAIFAKKNSENIGTVLSTYHAPSQRLSIEFEDGSLFDFDCSQRVLKDDRTYDGLCIKAISKDGYRTAELSEDRTMCIVRDLQNNTVTTFTQFDPVVVNPLQKYTRLRQEPYINLRFSLYRDDVLYLAARGTTVRISLVSIPHRTFNVTTVGMGNLGSSFMIDEPKPGILLFCSPFSSGKHNVSLSAMDATLGHRISVYCPDYTTINKYIDYKTLYIAHIEPNRIIFFRVHTNRHGGPYEERPQVCFFTLPDGDTIEQLLQLNYQQTLRLSVFNPSGPLSFLQ
jgi:hypothetical protein